MMAVAVAGWPAVAPRHPTMRFQRQERSSSRRGFALLAHTHTYTHRTRGGERWTERGRRGKKRGFALIACRGLEVSAGPGEGGVERGRECGEGRRERGKGGGEEGERGRVCVGRNETGTCEAFKWRYSSALSSEMLCASIPCVNTPTRNYHTHIEHELNIHTHEQNTHRQTHTHTHIEHEKHTSKTGKRNMLGQRHAASTQIKISLLP